MNKNIWNEKFKEKGWETTVRYSSAVKSGFYIEALVLSVNMLKSILSLVIENKYKNNGVSQKNIEKRLYKKDKDVDELIKLARDAKVFDDESTINMLRDYWKNRCDAVHSFVNGKIEYPKIKEVVKDFSTLYKKVQDEILVFKTVDKKS